MAPNNTNGDKGYFHIKVTEEVYEEYIKIDQNKRYQVVIREFTDINIVQKYILYYYA